MRKLKPPCTIATSSAQRQEPYFEPEPRRQPPRKVKCTNTIKTISNQRQKTRYHAKRKRNLHLDGTDDEVAHDTATYTAFGDEITSQLSRSVVSLASFDGDVMHFACTGIVVRIGRGYSVIMTSSNLINKEAFGPIHPLFQLTIKVRLPDSQVVPGVLDEYFSSHNLAFVTITDFPFSLRAAHLKRGMLLYPFNDWLFSVRRCFNLGNLEFSDGVLDNSNLTATDGIPIRSLSEEFSKVAMSSTCNSTKAGTGGPLVDLHGNIVGMNIYNDREMTIFIPIDQIQQFLVKHGIIIPFCHSLGSNQEGCTGGSGNANGKQESSTPYICSATGPLFGSPTSLLHPRESDEPFDEDPSSFRPAYHWIWVADGGLVLQPYLSLWEPNEKKIEDLRSKGYPLPIYDDGGMDLRGTFEEEFGQNMWSNKHTNRLALKMFRDIVSLASFNGKERFFVCSGVFINSFGYPTSRVLTSASLVRTSGDENKIDHNLRIEVCLPSKRRAIGTLEHYNLHYNVAVINIMDIRSHRPAVKIMGFIHETQSNEVVALGRGFESGVLMATDGLVTDNPSRFDCTELKVSTCKISKAGIGGPLIDFNGNFVGMNFYDTEETPYLPGDVILKLLRHFNAKRASDADGIMDKCTYRWPVPDPYWYYPGLDRPRQGNEMILE